MATKELYSVPVRVGRPVKKAKFHVKVDIYENGAAVTIKSGKRIIGSRLFTGDHYTKEYADWVDKKITDPANLKKALTTITNPEDFERIKIVGGNKITLHRKKP